ncbi:molybdopterin oxidoreductase [Zafaria cholistanensis]|uniref:Molybdopterin oxidoreductase n=1 Tax=Zafaria cholistanensis TaxID=1682741 RepID=A0A5A7NPJ7_9MICC|nr:molybdopterin oxidoreductase family protein [Zafaria cholistanensis]GER22705.1 molybdopterin oxidoreductase [Zafaria cholistanensis]
MPQAGSTPANTPTHCPYCALQCAMSVSPGGPADGTAGSADRGADVQPRQFPANGGALCRKGWSSAQLLGAADRIVEPLLRGPDGVLRPAAWDEVLDLVAAKVRTLRAAYGPDAVAVFGAGGLTNEKAYQLGKFARLALGTRLIDYNGRFCMSSAAAAGNRSFGLDRGLPFPLADLGGAGAILLLGSNVAETMPPFVRHLQGARDAGGLMVVDPRRSATARLSDDGAGLHLQPTPGTDLPLLLSLAHIVLAEGLADEDYLASRTVGRDAVARSVAPWWPERAQATTGVPADLLRTAARRLAEAARAARAGGAPVYVLTGRGVEQHVNGTDTTTAAINLALLLGLPGTRAGGFGTLTGQGNGQGGREHGQKSDQLPGYRKITDPAHRAHVAAAWGVDESLIPGPGVPAAELLHSLGLPGGPRMLFVHGSNVAVSAPDAGRVMEGLRRLDFLVVADFFLSETAAEADVVLPVLQWAEEEGTMTNLEGRILRRRRAVTPPSGARSELWIMAELARRLDSPGRFPTDAREVFEELREASRGGLADYSGIDYAALDAGEAVYWPCPADASPAGGTRAGGAARDSAEEDSAEKDSAEKDGLAGSAPAPGPTLRGTPRLFMDRFAHPDGKARMVAVRFGAPAEQLNLPGTLTLLTGRLLEHYQSGAQTRRVPELNAAQPELRAELHPATAVAHGVADGDMVLLSNGRGRVVARATLDSGMRTDCVFLPFHFPGDASANLLTSPATDPVSSMPGFKNASVSLSALPAGLPADALPADLPPGAVRRRGAEAAARPLAEAAR